MIDEDCHDKGNRVGLGLNAYMLINVMGNMLADQEEKSLPIELFLSPDAF